MTEVLHTFDERHEVLMDDPNAALPCCYVAPGSAGPCDALATHSVVRQMHQLRWEVLPRKHLPFLRDRPEQRGEPSRARQHPEFCLADAERICALRQGRPQNVSHD